MTGDGYHGLTLEYNTLGKVSRVKSAKVSYTYLADGTKVSALDASGNGLLYSGAMVFRKDGSVRSAESVGYSGGRFVADASGVLRPQIHVVDHLGSVRAIVGKSGNIVERDSYYPYGERWNDGSVEQADNRYRYNGKEEQSGFGLPYLDYGARLYDPATGRWLTQDPLSEKYYGISPYAFCAGNPMKYVDADGMRIFPKGQEELDMIRNTLPIADREYVNIDKNGYIDSDLLSSHKSESENYNRLKTMADSDKTIMVLLNFGFAYYNENKQLRFSEMQYYGVDDSFIGNLSGKGVGTSTGETGFLGKALFPGATGLQNSPDNNIYLIINSKLSFLGRAEMFSHEGYGHAYIYILTDGNRNAASHDYDNGIYDKNRILYNIINNAINETGQNYSEGM